MCRCVCSLLPLVCPAMDSRPRLAAVAFLSSLIVGV